MKSILLAIITVLLFQTTLSALTDLNVIESYARLLSHDSLNGRGVGTNGNAKAREFLISELKKLNVAPAGQDGYLQAFSVNAETEGVNILGIIYPESVSKSAEPPLAPTVLLSAHFDHVTDRCGTHPKAESKVCNGAADNAAAVAAVLAAIPKIAGEAHAPVAVALWDGEEAGLLGSKHFVKNPTFETSQLKLMINLDIVGANSFEIFKQRSYAIGAETGGEELKKLLSDVTEKSSLKISPFTYGFGHYRSDMTSFVLSERPIPFVFFSDGDGAGYHTDADEFQYLNLDKVAGISKFVANLAIKVSSADVQFQYVPPQILYPQGMPKGIVLPTLTDVKQVLATYQALAESEVVANWSPEMQKRFSDNLLLLKNVDAAGVMTPETGIQVLLAGSFVSESSRYHFRNF